MTPTQLHAGYVLPPNASKKPTTPAEKITAMLRGCGIEILPNKDDKQEVSALPSKDGNPRYYHGISTDTDKQAVIAKFDAAHPQHKGKLDAANVIARDGGTRRVLFALDFSSWQ